MENSLVELVQSSAAAAWLTKTIVDLIRTRFPDLGDLQILIGAFVFAVIFNTGWAFYLDQNIGTGSAIARVGFQSVLSFLGAVATTEAHTAARTAVKKAAQAKELGNESGVS